MGFMAGKAHCLGTRIKKNCQLNHLARQGHWLNSAEGQNSWLTTLLKFQNSRNAALQDLRTGCC